MKLATKTYFENFPPNARLWIFMSDRPMTESEINQIQQYFSAFLPQWKAHGNALKADFEIIAQHFLVFVVDEDQAQASGCSIDSLTHEVQKLENTLQISFTNRMLVATEQQDEINLYPLPTFKQKVKSGEISSDTFVFYNGVSRLADFWQTWKLPLHQSWAKSLIPS